MNYLKTLFPVVNTLPDHLRFYTALTEAEILASTKYFRDTIIVCDKSAPGSPFNGTSAPCQFQFEYLYDIAQQKRQRQGQLLVKDSMNTMPWFRFHKATGDAILRYFLEVAFVFRALDKSECPNFLVQIAGPPVFPIGKNVACVQQEVKKKSKKLKKAVQGVDKQRDEDREDPSVGDQTKKRKKHRRGKRKKQRKIVPDIPQSLAQLLTSSASTSRLISTIQDSRKSAAASLRLLAKRFLHCIDLRERFVNSRHPIAKLAIDNQPINDPLLERTFGFNRDDLLDMDATIAIQKLVPTLQRWVILHKRCMRYKVILDHFCPVDESLLSDKDNDKEQLSMLIQQYCSTVHVRRALEAIFFRVVPLELFGEDNIARLLNAMINFVVNAGRYDATSLHQLASIVKTSNCTWLNLVKNNALRQHLLLRILNLLVRYLLCVVSSCFYVTESQSNKNRLFFYRKPIWRRVTKIATQEFKSKCQLERIEKKKIIKGAFYGPFSLRWIPKSCGEVRPIICSQQGQRRSFGGGTVKVMNIELKPILAIVQYLVREKPEIFGHAASGFTDIHSRWKAYIQDQRKSQDPPQSNRYYMVKADVSSCFDSINQKLLWTLLDQELLSDAPDTFELQGHWLIRSGTKDNTSGTTVISRKFRYKVTAETSRGNQKYGSLAKYYKEDDKFGSGNTKGKSGWIVVPKGDSFQLAKAVVAERLKRLIFKRILALNGRRYVQNLGIAQGSSMSVLLCNLYLAALERKYLDPLVVNGEDLLMRHIDDFFYVTPSLERAKNFAEASNNGFPEFNCYFKLEKTVTNFATSSDQCNDYFIPNVIPWCGLMFHSNTMNVLIDHERLRSTDMRDFITIEFAMYPPSFVTKKLLHYLRTRTFRIIMDKSINSPLTLRRNVQILIRFISKCYGAYVKSYVRNLTVDDGAKKRLCNQDFIKELASRIFDALRGKLVGRSKNVVRLKTVENAFFSSVGCLI